MLLVTSLPLGIGGECNPDKEVARYLIVIHQIEYDIYLIGIRNNP